MVASNVTLSLNAIEAIRDLVRIDLDSAEGFRATADQINDPYLSDIFRTLAERRRRFAEVFRERVQMDERDAGLTPTLTDDLRRWWIDHPGLIQSGDAYTLLTEIARGEDVIMEKYENLLPKINGSAIAGVVAEQYASIKTTAREVQVLRDRYAGAD